MDQSVTKTRPRKSITQRKPSSHSAWRMYRSRPTEQHATVQPVELLEFLMGERGLTRADLGRILGSRSSASLVLNRKRGLSKNHIRKLAAHFKVSPTVFLRSEPEA